MTDELPPGWVETTIGDVCLPVSQRGPSSDKASFRYVDLGAMDNKRRRIADPSTVPTAQAPSRAKQIVRAGDVVFSTVRVYLENIGLVPPELDGEVASTAFCVLRPASGIDPRYLYYYVTSRPFIISVNKSQRGNSPPSVQDGDVRRQRLPIAPSEEQGRIASKIDELFSRIDEGERALERVSILVERYRQSVLKAAVTGELTSAWREKNKDTLESGEALLARILTARREAWEESELAKMKAKGITPANDKWKQKYEEPSPPDPTGLPALPEGWAWASAEQVCDSITKGTTPPANEMFAGSGDVPYIKVYNLSFDGTLDFAKDPTFISTKTHQQSLARSRLVPGDIVMNIVGPPLGKVSIVPDSAPEWNMNQAVAVFRPFDGCSNQFLAWYLLSRAAQDWYARKAKTTAGQVNLTLEICRRTPIPLAPTAEQTAITQLVEVEFSRLTDLFASLNSGRKTSLGLRQSVLSTAFAGQLVNQDPTDEPASALLERITTERATDTTAPKRDRKKRMSA